MSEPASASQAAAPPFPSLAAMRDEHTRLLRRQRESGNSPVFLNDVRRFLDRGQATGTQLDIDNDRSTAQTLLDYWTTALFRATHEEMPEVALAEFDAESGGELPDELCPYARLGDMSDEQTALYFGSQRLIAECIERLKKFHLVAIVGATGSGRSSLANFGLIRALKAGAIPGSERWQYFPPIVPGDEPLNSLARGTLPESERTENAIALRAKGLRRDPNHLARVYQETGIAGSALLVDEFEQVFSRCGDKHDRRAFVENLLNAARSPAGTHAVILVLRSDYASQVGQFEELQQLLQREQAQVPMAFTTSELREAIEEPAKRVGLRFDEGLVDQLLLDIQGDPAALSLLQFTLLQMWEHRQRNRITWGVYIELGAGRLALERTAESVYTGLSPDAREIARRIFMQLVSPGARQEVTCRSVPRDQLVPIGIPVESVDRVVQRFVQARLLRVTAHENSPDRPQSAEVAVAHESLVGHWTRLQQWLDEERDTRRRRSLLTAAAQQWHEKGRDPGDLWRGSLLEESLTYRDLSDSEQQFVDASERAEKTRTARRVQLFVAAIAAVVLIAALAIISLVAERQRAMERADNLESAKKIADAHQDVLNAKNRALNLQFIAMINERGFHLFEDGDLSGSLLWSMEAWNSERGDEARRQLHRARVGAGLSQMPRLARQWSNENLSTAYTEFSRDGRYYAMARGSPDGRQGEAEVWDGRTDTTKRLAMDLDSGSVNWISFSPNGRYLVTASGQRGGATGQLRVWEMETCAPMGNPLPLPGAAITATFDQSGDRVICATEENQGRHGVAVLWNWRTGEVRSLLESGNGPVYQAAFSRDGRRVVIATENTKTNSGEVHVLDGSTGQAVCPPLKHRGAVNWASFSPDESGQYIVTASGDQSSEAGEARVWNTSTGAPRTPVLRHESGVAFANFSPNGLRVVTAGHDGNARVWDAATGRELRSFLHKSSVNRASFSPDGRFLATASRDRTARVWDLVTGEAVTPLLFHLGTVSSAVFSPNGRWLATSSRSTAQIWNLDTGSPAPAMLNTAGSVKHVACSDDGQTVITISRDPNALRDRVDVWELDSGVLVAQLEPEHDVSVAAISADGQIVATVSAASDGGKSTIRVASASTGELLATTKIAGTATIAAFSPPRAHLLLTVSKQTDVPTESVRFTLHVHDALTGNPIAHADLDDAVNYAAFSPDSSRIVVASGDIRAKSGTARVFDTRGKLVTEFKRHTGGVIHASFSPDGRQVITAGADDRAWIWSASNGEALQEALQHTADVTHASFSDDGQRVLTVSYDPYKTRVWEANSGKLLAGIEHGVKATLSPDGLRAATVGRDGIAKVWDVSSKLLIAELKHSGDVETAIFSADGEMVMTVCTILSKGDDVRADLPARTVPKRLARTQAWKISERRSLDDLSPYVHLISSRKIDREKVGLIPLDSESLAAIRAQLRPEFSNELLTRPSRKFYVDEANNPEANEQWFAAAWHLEQAIADPREPPDPELFLRLGWAYSQLGRWDDAIKSYAEAIKLDSGNWARWSYRAWANLRARNWTAAKEDYDRALALSSAHPQLVTVGPLLSPTPFLTVPVRSAHPLLLAQRATALTELGQWDKAAEDLAQLIELKPNDHEYRYHLAVSYLAQGNAAAYRQVCIDMLGRAESEQDPVAVNDFAWACVLAPNAVPDPALVVKLAERIVGRDPRNYYYLNTLGAALYRAGDHEAAAQKLREAMRSHTGQFLAEPTSSPDQQTGPARPIVDELGTPYDWYFMAMAEHQLGHKDQAQYWISRADHWLKQRIEEASSPQNIASTPLAAISRQELVMLRREAESVLKQQAPPN